MSSPVVGVFRDRQDEARARHTPERDGRQIGIKAGMVGLPMLDIKSDDDAICAGRSEAQTRVGALVGVRSTLSQEAVGDRVKHTNVRSGRSTRRVCDIVD